MTHRMTLIEKQGLVLLHVILPISKSEKICLTLYLIKFFGCVLAMRAIVVNLKHCECVLYILTEL